MKRLLALCLSMTLAMNGMGDVTLDSSGPHNLASGVSSITFAHTVTGANPAITVTVDTELGTSPSVTYNGDSLTKLVEVINVGYDETWGLINPDLGTNNVVVTFFGVAADGATHAASWNNVSAFGDTDVRTSPSNATTSSLTLTTVAGDMVLNHGLTWAESPTSVTNSEFTLYNTTYNAAATTIKIYSAYIAATGTSRVTGWTRDTGNSYMDLTAVVLSSSSVAGSAGWWGGNVW